MVFAGDGKGNRGRSAEICADLSTGCGALYVHGRLVRSLASEANGNDRKFWCPVTRFCRTCTRFYCTDIIICSAGLTICCAGASPLQRHRIFVCRLHNLHHNLVHSRNDLLRSLLHRHHHMSHRHHKFVAMELYSAATYAAARILLYRHEFLLLRH